MHYFFFAMFLFALGLQACRPIGLSVSEDSQLNMTAEPQILTNRYVNFPLRTKGRYIVDSSGRRVKLRSINWYGASDDYYVPLGLYTKHRDELAQQIVTMKFNSVRLPFANQLLSHKEPVVSHFLKANPDLLGKNPMEVFDSIIQSLTKVGLIVILNNHTSDATWCCSGNDNNGLWYNDQYSEERWIKDWEEMARRYKDNKYVIGADLRNELRRNHKMGISPDWGNGGSNDWKKAAAKAGNAIHKISPHWLIVIEGLSYSADFSKIKSSPLRLNIANRIVYSPHAYHWFTNFSEETSYEEAKAYWNKKWGFFVKDLDKPYTAPLWVSEFGNGLKSNKPNSKARIWWKYLMCYMQEIDIGYSYWSFTGGKIKAANGPDTPKNENTAYTISWNNATYGLNDRDWEPIKEDFRLQDIQRYLFPNRKPIDSPKPEPCSR